MKRAVGLGVALHEAAVVVGEPREGARLGARRGRCPLDDGLHLARVHRDAGRRLAMAEEAEFLSPELAFGALGVELPAAEDLEDLRDVEQVLFQRRRVHQAIVHINERARAQWARGPWDPAMDGRKARAWGWGRGASGRAPLEVETGVRLRREARPPVGPHPARQRFHLERRERRVVGSREAQFRVGQAK